ncbi:MAG: carnitine dehydratase [Salinisphaeraceae bacterium]|nr:carnitine dehydratase [Salinisphaeraceae bacterium]
MALLEGLKVVDFTRLLPGPLGTLFLADFGAEVIKIEEPGGDPGRVNRDGSPAPRFGYLNRGKKSLALDLKTDAGRDAALRLIAQADVVVEQFRPGVMARLGLDYATLSADHPRLIYCAISGYGQNGPYAQRAGHDGNYLSLLGLIDQNRAAAGPPHVLPTQVADIGGGSLLAVIAVLAALVERNRSGHGQFIDVSMFEGLLPWLAASGIPVLAGEPPEAPGEGRLTGGFPSYGVYPTADGRYMLAGGLEWKFWERLVKTLGVEDIKDQAYALGPAGQAARARLAEAFGRRTQAEWEVIFAEVDCCVTPVRSLDEIAGDPHLRARGMLLPRPEGGLMPDQPLRFSRTPTEVDCLWPELNADAHQVLTGLGYSDEQIRALAPRQE